MRIAIDIDSTLHDYWAQLEAAAWRRFGVRLAYATQTTWAIDRLRPEQLRACIAETHGDASIRAAQPYADAVAVVSRWSEAGHEIVVASHRAPETRGATVAWLAGIELPYRTLACCEDKVAWCATERVDLLIDDAPDTLARALAAGMVAATLEHPWNRDVREEEDVLSAPDWLGLERALAEPLARSAASPAP